MSVPAAESPEPESPQPPWYRHPIFLGTLAGALLGIVLGDVAEPAGPGSLYDPWDYVILFTWYGFILGLIKASFDGLPVGAVWIAIAILVLLSPMALFFM